MLEGGADQLDKWCERWSVRRTKLRNFLHTIEGKKSNWIGHIVRSNITELKIDRNINRTGRRGKRGKQLLDD